MPFLWGEKVHYFIIGMFRITFVYAIDLEKFTPKLKEVVGSKCPLVAF